MIVSHIHPSTVEGVALLSEAMVPGLQDSASTGEEEFFWSVDIHCGSGGDGSDSEGSDSGGGDSGDDGDGGSGSDGGGTGVGGSDRGASDGERGGEGPRGDGAEKEGEGGGSVGGHSDSLGPSAYMARKVGGKQKTEFKRR